MNKFTSNVLTMAIAAVLVTGLSACNRSADASAGSAASSAAAPVSGSGAENSGTQYGKVVSVTPVHKTSDNPKQVCHDETVTHTAPPKDEHRLIGSALGAVAGGLLGNQVGGGRGRTLATVAGAVGGGYAGNRIEANRQHGQVTTSVERRCSTVNNSTSSTVGYDVKYIYNGVTRTARMDHDPGDRVQVQQGVIAVSDVH